MLDYCFAPDPSVPTRIQVYELWETVTRSQPIFSIRIITRWLRSFMAQVSSKH